LPCEKARFDFDQPRPPFFKSGPVASEAKGDSTPWRIRFRASLAQDHRRAAISSTSPCHGSKYDGAGRVYSGVPAPYNLPVPPYRFLNDTTLRVGENPSGSNWDFGSILQL
jgi:hypothetical protein